MGCFIDIINHAFRDKTGLGIVIFYCFLAAILYIGRNYYIGRIVQSLNIYDLYKYTGLTICSYIINIVLNMKINSEIIDYEKNIFKRFIKIFFRLDFKNVLQHNESIMSDMNESFQNIGGAAQSTYIYFIQQSILIVLTILIFFYYLKNVAIIIVATLAGIYFLQRYIINLLKEKWDEYWKEYVKFNKLFQDVMLNIWSVKYNTLEHVTETYLKEKFHSRMEKMYLWLNTKIIALNAPDFTFFVVIIYNLYTLIHNQNIQTDLRVFLILQTLKIWKEFHILCNSSSEIYQNIKYIEKICPVWLLEEKEIEKEDDIKTDIIHTIEFNNVSYGYIDNKKVLNNMKFKIDKGQTVSLLGKSGSGKSTIINLICRLYDVKKGDGIVLVNNNDIKNHNIKYLRECINVVPQNFNVFDMTIKENIVLEDKYDEEKIKFLVKLLNLPDINLDAKTLSHGQKQRVIIGRTLYRENKSVYIFDEYLSAVDQKQSKVIHDYVLDFIKKNSKIGIFISHNPERMYSTDKIIKLE